VQQDRVATRPQQKEKTLSRCVLTVLLALLSFAVSSSRSEAQGSRQYYSGTYSNGAYNYRYHYYKPRYSSSGYKYHLAIYYPQRSRYVYYYNPYSRKYWGRYDLVCGGYSQLAPEDQRGQLSEIPEKAFPAPGPMPAVRESNDETPMLPPPEVLGPPGGPAVPGRGGLQLPPSKGGSNCPN
jgi:hypothetical protein